MSILIHLTRQLCRACCILSVSGLLLLNGKASAQAPLVNKVSLISTIGGGFDPSSMVSGDRLLFDVTSLGDLDGDGVPELAFGSISDKGCIFVVYLDANGTVKHQTKIGHGLGGFPSILSSGDGFGGRLACIGDLDGDGLPELAASVVNDDQAGTDYGAFYILFLKADGTVRRYTKITTGSGGFTGTIGAADHFGLPQVIGDVDNDGVQDLLVTEFEDNDGGTNRGAVWVLFMNTDGTVKGHQKISATNGGLAPVTFGSNQNFGRDAIGMGDLDLDGVEDIAVSTYFEDDLGSLYIIFLNANGTVKGKQKVGRYGVGGLAGTFNNYDGFAFSLACMGDLDGDGIQDLAAGTRLFDSGYTDAGAVFILYMNRNGTVKSQAIIADNTNVPAALGLEANAQFGFSVANIGDVDGDGTVDMAVAAVTEDEGGTDMGTLRVLFMHGPLQARANVEHVTAWLDSIGRIEVTPKGGKGPYTYSWSGGGTSAVRENLPAGDYTVTITDALSATTTRTYTVGERTAVTSLIGLDEKDGLLLKTAANGWGNSGLSTQRAIPLGGTGSVRTTVEQTDAKLAFGLTTEDVDAELASMPYYFLVDTGRVNVYTAGTARLVGTLPTVQVGDVLTVVKQAAGGGGYELLFKKNGTTLYTASMGADAALFGDMAAFKQDGKYGNVLISVAEFVPTVCTEGRDMNTVTERTYDLNGDLIGLSKVFSDDRGRPLQAQTYDLADHNVMATATVYDAYGRPVLSTLPVPTFQDEICYKEDLITADSGAPYDASKFDVRDHTGNASTLTLGEVDKPKPVDRVTQGTLGWYYSDNNTAEPLTPAADRPYSRIRYNELSLGQVLKASMVGNGLEMGSGHESYGFTMPAAGELHQVFGLINSWDAMVTLCVPEVCWVQGDENAGDVDDVLWGHAYPESSTVDKVNYQVMKSISRDPNGKERVSFTDIDGKLVATCYSGAVDGVNKRTQHVESVIGRNSGDFVDIHLPAGCESTLHLYQDPNENLDYRIIDLATGEAVNFATSGPADYIFSSTDPDLPPGVYRIFLVTNTAPADVHDASRYISPSKLLAVLNLQEAHIEYDLNYYDFALNYYDKAGRLVQTIPPNGVDYLEDNEIDADYEQFDVHMDDAGGSSPNWTLLDGVNPYDRIDRSVDQAPDEHSQVSNLTISLLTTVRAVATENKVKSAPSTSTRKAIGAVLRSMITDVGPTSPTPEPEGFCKPCLNAGYLCPKPQCPGSDGTGLGEHPEQPFTGTYSTCWVCVPNDAYEARYIIDFDILVENAGPGGALVPIMTGLRFDAIRSDAEWSISTNSTAPAEPDQVHQAVIDPAHSGHTSKYVIRVNNIAERVYDAGAGSYVEGDAYTYLNELRFRVERETFAFTDVVPEHTMATKHMYNSLDQQVAAYDPDAGLSFFAYRRDGKLRFSQNAEQRVDDEFSYTNYDAYGRVVEFGVYDRNTVGSGTGRYFVDQYGQLGDVPPFGAPTTGDILNDLDGIADDSRCSEVTHIQYDDFDATELQALTGLSATAYKGTWLTGRVATSWNDEARTWYSYDEYGRVRWAVMKYTGDLPVKTIDYAYDNAGKLRRTIYQDHNPAERFIHQFSYDADQRLKYVHTIHKEWNGNTYLSVGQEEAKYEYYLHGPLKRVQIAKNAQGVDFLYTINGWLKGINSPDLGETVANSFHDPGGDATGTNGVHADLFGEALDYFTGDYERAGTFVNWGQYTGGGDQYNGNLKSVRWSNQGAITASLDPSGDIAARKHNIYSFTYNDKDWLKTATYGKYKSYVFNPASGLPQLPSEQESGGAGTVASNAYKLSNLTYDPCGNLLTMTRSGTAANLAMDQFTYRYQANTNRLLSIKDAAGTTSWTTEDLEDQDPSNAYVEGTSGTWNYQYDKMGRMTQNNGDGQKVKYNAAGLVTEVRSLSNVLKVKYTYDQTGQRIQKVDYNGSGVVTLTTWYVRGPGGSLLSIHEQEPGSTEVLQVEVPIGGNLGTMYAQADHASIYALKDHLGNVRVTFTRAGDVDGWTDYEPWGMPMVGRMAVSSLAYRYGFQGQETDQIGGVRTPAFELRLWDARIGRWNTTDPYGQFWSPYVGMGNRPHSSVDPDGGFSLPGAFAGAVIGMGAGGLTAWATGADKKTTQQLVFGGLAAGFLGGAFGADIGRALKGGGTSLISGVQRLGSKPMLWASIAKSALQQLVHASYKYGPLPTQHWFSADFSPIEGVGLQGSFAIQTSGMIEPSGIGGALLRLSAVGGKTGVSMNVGEVTYHGTADVYINKKFRGTGQFKMPQSYVHDSDWLPVGMVSFALPPPTAGDVVEVHLRFWYGFVANDGSGAGSSSRMDRGMTLPIVEYSTGVIPFKD